MAEITAKTVRDLREQSGAGMMACKKALTATNGDVEAAFDHLRKQGLKAAEKKAGRDTAEGRALAVSASGSRRGALVAISCETDFVAKTPQFEGFMTEFGAHVLEHGSAEGDALAAQPWNGEEPTVGDALKALIGKLGENFQVAGAVCYENADGYVVSYVHHDQKKAAIVSVTTSGDAEKAAAILRDLCMHIVVFSPTGKDRDSIPAEQVERERAIFMEEVKSKPAEIQEKIVSGKLDKFYAGTVVSEQPWVKDDKVSVQKALEQELGAGTKIVDFARLDVGA
ncbi:MAG: elongation factor Ts [Chlamydiales bacterium]|jgi:elongation factor Ts